MAEPATFEQLLELFPSDIAGLCRRADQLIRSTIPVGGSAVSHVKLRTAADLERPGVKALLQAAAKRSGL
jgi:hypothetical protein